MIKPLVVGHLTDQEMTEMAILETRYAQIMAQRAAVDQQILDHGGILKEMENRIIKAHRLEHGCHYRFAKNGEIHRVIPDEPPIAGMDNKKGVN